MGQGYWEQGGSPLPCMCVCMRILRTEEFDIPYGKSFSSWLPPHFRPIVGKTNNIVLKEYMASTTKSAYKVMVLWPVLAAIFCKGAEPYRHVYDNCGILGMRSNLRIAMMSFKAAD